MSSEPAPVLVDSVAMPSANLASFFGHFAEAFVGENKRIMPAGYTVAVDFYKIYEEGPRSNAASVFIYDKPTSKVTFSAEIRQDGGNVALYCAPIKKWGMAVVMPPLVYLKIKRRAKTAFRVAFTKELNRAQEKAG
jgi:hypothetical protein